MNRLLLMSMTLLCALAACSSRDSLDGRGPDEYMTMSNPPLILPPDFSLRAPETPVETASVVPTQTAPAENAAVSAGEKALLNEMGPSDADIRKKLDEDAAAYEKNTPVLDKKLKSRKAATTVKPEQEAEKLQQKGVSTTGKKKAAKKPSKKQH